MSPVGCIEGCRIAHLTSEAKIVHRDGCPNGSTAQETYETVDHPKHYNDHPAGIECIDVIEEFPLNVGMTIKYLWRAGLKPGVDADEDFRKAIWYIERERERRKRRGYRESGTAHRYLEDV